MSAPWEVWLTDSDEGWLVTGKLKGEQRNSPRYLRADLVCGECACGRWTECPFCNEENDLLTNPACMAFVPKEAK